MWIAFFLPPDLVPRNLDETTATTPVVELKVPGVTTPSETVSHSSSAAPHVRVKQQPNSPFQVEYLSGDVANGPDNCCFKFYPRRFRANLVESYYLTDPGCLKPAVIFLTKKSRSICVDPSLSWVDNIMKTLDQSPF
ncbi:unnamed protein product [Oreochromis niloticus]|nr:unnamed protein product [Mustela putorius furo]